MRQSSGVMLAPEAHEHYLALGRRYTAHQVLEQSAGACASCSASRW
jgi:hypothetical protein